MNYVPHTSEDRSEMLKTIGVSSIDELFSDVPSQVKLDRKLNLPPAMSEFQLMKYMSDLAGKNTTTDRMVSFLGAGVYDHYVPSVVKHIISRSEFYTSYTPYQAEVSQGMLQSIFEYQTLMCELTAMDISNASLYDGATAITEAAMMASRLTRKQEVIISQAVHPDYRRTLRTYAHNLELNVTEVPFKDGSTDIKAIRDLVSDSTACVILQSPNFFGCIENMALAAEAAHEKKALFVACVDPISLGIIAPPGEYGADIAVGEAQGLGIPMGFGGPHLGFMTCRKEHMRQMPGRVAGETHDNQGRRGYLLTLQAREQHIRRDRATSNICSNQALCALAATVYLSWLGKQGIKEVAEQCVAKAHYACEKLSEIPGFERKHSAPFFKEFAVKTPVNPEKLCKGLLEASILGGLPLGRFYSGLSDSMLVAVTEKRTKGEIDALCRALEGLV
ncbi:MAG TPA: aminomethyl-transferring glycine dehydrogenase subunit GcvPA [Firmicutes bacterium]|jgi:glycine dehydrogenase subunit 1|nr:aminomethyl-transferring glycine dehydrogenase subunit GcvPA [Bacillota bacterium]